MLMKRAFIRPKTVRRCNGPGTVKLGSVVLVRYPFTDSTSTKERPAIVFRNWGYHYPQPFSCFVVTYLVMAVGEDETTLNESFYKGPFALSRSGELVRV